MNRRQWEVGVQSGLRQIADRIHEYDPELLYGEIAACVISPLINAVRVADFEAILSLPEILDGQDAKLIAGKLREWLDLDFEALALDLIEEVSNSQSLREIIATLIKSLNAITMLQEMLDKPMAALLLKSLRDSSLLPSVSVIDSNTSQGPANVETPKKVSAADGSLAVAGDISHSLIVLNPHIVKADPGYGLEYLQRQISNYLKWVLARWAKIELHGIEREGKQIIELDLDAVYVPLEAQHFGESPKSVELGKVLGLGPRLSITGGPGSGKTTVLLHIAWALAKAIVDDKPSFAYEKVGYKDFVLIKIRQYLEDIRTHLSGDLFDLEKIRRNSNDVALRIERRNTDPHRTTLSRDVIRKQQEEEAVDKAILENLWQEFRQSTQPVVDRLDEVSHHAEMRFPCGGHIPDKLRRLSKSFRAYCDSPIWYQYDRLVEFINEAEVITHAINSEPPGIPIPIFVSLSEYSAYIQEAPRDSARHERRLADYISKYLKARQAGFDLSLDFFSNLIRSGMGVVLLLDGLDEVSNETERLQVVEAIKDLVAGCEWINVVVTCRTVAYTDRTVLGSRFEELRVKPLEHRHIRRMVWQAYRCILPTDAEAQRRSSLDLIKGVVRLEAERRKRQGPDVTRLIASPLLVRMLLIVHYSDRHLPEQRAALYMRTVEVLLHPKHSPDQSAASRIAGAVGGSVEHHLDLITHLAFAMHSRGESQKGEINESELRSILNANPAHAGLVDALIHLTRARGTLLEERHGIYRFVHLSFQEYLTARYLAEMIRDLDKIQQFLNAGPLSDIWWREPILLLVGYLYLISPPLADRMIHDLADLDTQSAGHEPKLAGAVIAYAAFRELPHRGEELGTRIAASISTRLGNSSERLSTRVAAGDSLNNLGDPRFDSDLYCLPNDRMLGFVEIPEGGFVMGDSRLPDSGPPHNVYLGKYFIAKYAVTVAQYKSFVRSSGFVNTGFPGLADSSNHPMRGLTWQHANEYCKWLDRMLLDREDDVNEITAILRSKANGKREWRVAMPSEAQWEKAARGIDGRVYPWGNQPNTSVCNCSETGLSQTISVGCFWDGSSAYGVEDLIGNVWEWTSSVYQHYPYPSDHQLQRHRENLNSEEPRVLRGGAFLTPIELATCAIRLVHTDPKLRQRSYGLRVAIVPNYD